MGINAGIQALLTPKQKPQFNDDNSYLDAYGKYHSDLLDKITVTNSINNTNIPAFIQDKRPIAFEGIINRLSDGTIKNIVQDLSKYVNPKTGLFKMNGDMTDEETSKAPLIHRAMLGLGSGIMNAGMFMGLNKFAQIQAENERLNREEMRKYLNGTADFVYGRRGAANRDAMTNKSASFNKDSDIRFLYNAQRMKALKKTPAQIRYATGWFLDEADNRWKKVGKDGDLIKNAKISEGQTVNLSDIYNAPELYKTYPIMKYMPVKFTDLSKHPNPEYHNYEAFYSPSTHTITINTKFYNGVVPSLRGTLVHEIQHAIQHEEGFATGTVQELLNSLNAKERNFYDNQFKPLFETYSKITSIPDTLLEDIWAKFDDKANALSQAKTLGLKHFIRPDKLYNIKQKDFSFKANTAQGEIDKLLSSLTPEMRKNINVLLDSHLDHAVNLRLDKNLLYRLLTNEAEARAADSFSRLIPSTYSLKNYPKHNFFSYLDVPRGSRITLHTRPEGVIKKPQRKWKNNK